MAMDARVGPVDAAERLDLLDVLRGFALGGVLLANAHVSFSGRELLPPERVQALGASTLNTVFWYVFNIFVSQKFFTIFATLFGIGFSIQLERAEARGASIDRLYARRLVGLLLIGLSHMVLLWYGDVLGSYAVIGFALLFFRRRSDRTLLICAFSFIFLVPLVFTSVERLLPLFTGSREAAEAAASAAMKKSAEVHADALATFSGGSYLSNLQINLIVRRDDYSTLSFLVVALSLTLGNFLFGFLAGRRRLFHEPIQHGRLFRRLLVWGLVAGVILNAVRTAIRLLFMHKVLKGDPWWRLLIPGLAEAGYLSLAAAYVSAITLLFQRLWWRRLLLVFAPAGRMALTNYLLQSVFGVIVYYGLGFGLIGKVGSAACFGLSFGVYCLELVLSHLWLSRFRYGPVEWLWRSMTYGRFPPMRRAEVSPA